MRCNQVSIFIERFGRYVPKNYPSSVQRISVYSDDSESIYEALAKANALAINELNAHEEIGVRSYLSTNAYSKTDYKELHPISPREENRYEDDLELQFTYKADKLRNDRIWAHENIDEIVDVIRNSESKLEARTFLKERFDLSEFQINKLFSMRLDMFSKDRYQNDIEDQEDFESRKKEKEGWSQAHLHHYYERKIRELQKELAKHEAYITIAENYSEIIHILEENPHHNLYAPIINERFGIDYANVNLVKYITIDDILSVEKHRKRISELEDLLEETRRAFEEDKPSKNV